MKRNARYFNKKLSQVYNAMRDIIFKFGLEIVESDKKSGMIKFVTKKSYIFFGGYEYTLKVREVSDQQVQVVLSSGADVSQNDVDKLADRIFEEMDKELPVNQNLD